METIEKVIHLIKSNLKNKAKTIPEFKKNRKLDIINPDTENYDAYGLKIKDIEEIVRDMFNKSGISYEDAIYVFKKLTTSNIEEDKFAGFLFLNRYKKNFDSSLIEIIEQIYSKYCHTWSHCDSTSIRLIGPFLAQKNNSKLAKKTLKRWIVSENLWVKRMALATLVKVIMLKKDFDQKLIFDLIQKALTYNQEYYIEKAIAWVLKTCSRYKPKLIYEYLSENKPHFSRLILREGSEKLKSDLRKQILEK